MLIITALVLIIGIIFAYIHYSFSYWERKGILHIKPKYPFGNAGQIGKTKHISTAFTEFYNQLKSRGKFGGVYLTFRPVLVLTDLDLIKQVLIKDFNVFPNRGAYCNEEDDPLSAHLVNLEDERWKNLRNKLTPTFTSGKLKMMFPTIADVADNLLEKMENNKNIDAKDLMGKFTTDVIGNCAFGLECNSFNDPNSEFFKMGQKVFEFNSFLVRFLRSSFPKIAKKLHVKSIPPEISTFYSSIVRNTIDYREKQNIQRNDFMNSLIQMKNSNGDDHLTFNQIAAQSFIFFVAGYETTATTLTYCLYELSINHHIQAKARDHIKAVLAKHNGEFTYDAVMEMNYLEQILNETLRKYPPASLVGRVAKYDYQVPGTTVVWQKGTSVNIPIHAIHHDPSIYPNPNKFDPERFNQEEISKRHTCAFMPFGEGNRICIGARFAVLEAKIAIAKILMKFELNLDETKTSVPLKISIKKILLHPAEGVYIKLTQL